MTSNRGVGAGGANTNKNGKYFETLIENKIRDRCSNIINYKTHSKFVFDDKELTYVPQNKLFKYTGCTGFNKLHGAKHPDQAFIDENNNIISIVEVKYQQGSGSAVEKLQTAQAKIFSYQQTMGDKYKIRYSYGLSNWFSDNAKGEIDYLNHLGVKYFWVEEESGIDNIIQWILDDSSQSPQ